MDPNRCAAAADDRAAAGHGRIVCKGVVAILGQIRRSDLCLISHLDRILIDLGNGEGQRGFAIHCADRRCQCHFCSIQVHLIFGAALHVGHS